MKMKKLDTLQELSKCEIEMQSKQMSLELMALKELLDVGLPQNLHLSKINK